MKLALIRDILVTTYTMGELLVDGRHLGWTLEDAVREQVGADGRYFWRPDFKIPGQTAIPCGTYEVVVTYSNRFRRPLPLVLGVPDFDAIRLHGGNDVKDTEGCPLNGLERDVSRGWVGNCAPVVDPASEVVT